LLSVEEARHRILASAKLTGVEVVALEHAAGRVPAAWELTAARDVPPFANAAMDGFAVRAADLPGDLRLVGEVVAGAGALPVVGRGEAVRIMTGAPLPPGADTVVPVEEAAETGDGRVSLAAAEQGRHVRPAGHDTRAGDRLDLPRAPLGAGTVALLASLGVGELAVRGRPVVAILSTGDELIAPGVPLGPGQIHDANSAALAAAVGETGGEARVLSRAADDPTVIEALLADASRWADLVLASGGVSMGRTDHVRTAIERLGALAFWKIAVQPGKPLAFGTIGDTPVIGLPGNPVSALVTFELFARPLIRGMLGLAGDGRLHLPARLEETVAKDVARRAYVRVVLTRSAVGLAARSAGGQGSAQLRGLAAANGLLAIPEGEPVGLAGETYDATLLGEIA
jgi:molybdopterin molybdotransferase